MRYDEGINRILQEVEYQKAKVQRTALMTPRLVLVHSRQATCGQAQRKEAVEYAFLRAGNRDYPLEVSRSGLVIADILARKQPRALTAKQIERILNTDLLYIGARTNDRASRPIFHRMTHRTIKVYIMRLREYLRKTLVRAGMAMDPKDILSSEITDVSNVVAYKFLIPCEIVCN